MTGVVSAGLGIICPGCAVDAFDGRSVIAWHFVFVRFIEPTDAVVLPSYIEKTAGTRLYLQEWEAKTKQSIPA